MSVYDSAPAAPRARQGYAHSLAHRHRSLLLLFRSTVNLVTAFTTVSSATINSHRCQLTTCHRSHTSCLGASLSRALLRAVGCWGQRYIGDTRVASREDFLEECLHACCRGPTPENFDGLRNGALQSTSAYSMFNPACVGQVDTYLDPNKRGEKDQKLPELSNIVWDG